MSVRIEWTTAALVGPRWLRVNERAPDGNKPAYGGGALIIGPLAIEGTPDELRALLARAADALPGADVASLLRDALQADGAHHKQWALERIAAQLGVDLSGLDYEPGVA